MKSALPWAVGAAVAAVTLVLFRDAAFGGRLPSDTVGIPDASFVGTVWEQAAAQVREGTLPLWFPEFDCGTPLAAAWMYGLLSPGVLLFAVLPLGTAWAATAALHLGWGAAGMTSFLRGRGCCAAGAVGGALLFAFSEFLVGRTTGGHLNLVLPLTWAPWVLRWADGCVRGESRAVPALGLCLGAGLLAGHVQTWLCLSPLLGALGVAEVASAPDRGAAFRRLAGGVLLAVGVAAVQIAVTAEFLAVAAPAAEDRSVILDVSAPPALLLSKILAAFPGTVPEGAGLDGRAEARGIAGIWAFGLAAWGVLRGAPRRWVWAGAAVFAFVAATGLRSPVSAWLQDLPPFSLARAPGRFLAIAVVAVPVLAGHGISALPGTAAVRASSAAAAGGLALLFGTPPVASIPGDLHRTEVAARLPEAIRAHRVHAPLLTQWTNLEAQGLETLRTPCYVRVAGYSDLIAEPSPAIAYWLDLSAGLHADLDGEGAEPTSLRNLAVERYEPMGRAHFFGDAVAGASDADALARLRSGERRLFVDGAAEAGGGTGTVRVAARSARTLALDVDASGPGWVLVSVKRYRGWTVTVDGEPAEERRGNLAFPAVRIAGAGRHRILLEYEPDSVALGGVVSLASLAAALLLVLRARRVGSAG